MGRDKETSIGIMPRIDTDEKITKLLDWLMQNEKIPTGSKVFGEGSRDKSIKLRDTPKLVHCSPQGCNKNKRCHRGHNELIRTKSFVPEKSRNP